MIKKLHNLRVHVSAIQVPLEAVASKLMEVSAIKQLITLSADTPAFRKAVKVTIDHSAAGCFMDTILRSVSDNLQDKLMDYAVLVLRQRLADLEAELSSVSVDAILENARQQARREGHFVSP